MTKKLKPGRRPRAGLAAVRKVTIRFTEEEYQAWRRRALTYGTTISQLIRDCADEGWKGD
jgi:hypothetical protein